VHPSQRTLLPLTNCDNIMADSFDPSAVSSMEASMAKMATSSATVADAMQGMQTSMGGMREYMETVNTSSDSLDAALKEIVTTVNYMARGIDEVADSVKESTTNMQKFNKETKSAAKNAGMISKFYAKMKKDIKGLPKSTASFAKSSAAQVTGMSIGLGTIVTLLLKAANNMRMLSGMTRQASAHFEGGQKQIGSARAAVMQLRRGFAATYEEAGGVVSSLAQMGMSAKEIEGTHFKKKTWIEGPVAMTEELKRLSKSEYNAFKDVGRLQRDLSDNQTTMTDEEFEHKKGLMKERMWDQEYSSQRQMRIIKDQKEASIAAHEASEKTRRREYKTTYGAAQELYAIEKAFGVKVQQSGMFVKQMEQDYGKANDEARKMLGAAIATATQIDNIGVDELLSDWQKMINSAQTYKTDVNGILALYNTMMRKEAQMGLKGVPVGVRKDIAATVTSWKASMDLGMKARLGKGATPAERALEFENIDYGEQLSRAMNFLREIVPEGIEGGTAAEKSRAKIKVRKMAEKMEFPPDVQKHLADAVVEGKITSEETKKMNAQYEAERDAVAKNEKIWNEQRGKLIEHAGKTATKLLTIQQLLERKAADFAANYLQPIVNWLSEIWGAVSKLWEDPEQKLERKAMEELTKTMSPAQASYYLTDVMKKHGGKGGALEPKEFAGATGFDLIHSYAQQQGEGTLGTGMATIGGLAKWVTGSAEEEREKYRVAATYASATRRSKELAADPDWGPKYASARKQSGKAAAKVFNDYLDHISGKKTPSAEMRIPGGDGENLAGERTPVGSKL